MSKIIGVTVRTREQLTNMNVQLVDALKYEINRRRGKRIPIIYQYLHNPNVPLVVDRDNTIGYIDNIRKDKDGNIVADLEMLNLLKIASNYQGIIDNIAASFKPNEKRITIDAFIIYDKVAKEEILQRKKERQTSMENRLAKPGEIPFMVSSDSNEAVHSITDKLMVEFNKRMSEEQSDNR